VQDAASGAPLPEARVFITLAPRRRPEHRLRSEATSAAATNKLLRSALFELSEAGWWEAEITVTSRSGENRGQETVRLPMNVAGRLPHWLSLWPWFVGPALAIALFALHQYLRRPSVDSPRMT
jgi:hypothetical protein